METIWIVTGGICIYTGLDWSITWSLYDGVSTRHCTSTDTGVTNIYHGTRHLTCIISAKLAYYRPIIALINYE